MDGRGGCCIARYDVAGGGSGASTYQMSKIDRIMLRYRPIAPKPADPAAACVNNHTHQQQYNHRRRRQPKATGRGRKRNPRSNTTTAAASVGNTTASGGSGGSKKTRRKSSSPETTSDQTTRGGDRKENKPPAETTVLPVVTLPLLPETPDLTAKPEPHRSPPALSSSSSSSSSSMPAGFCYYYPYPAVTTGGFGLLLGGTETGMQEEINIIGGGTTTTAATTVPFVGDMSSNSNASTVITTVAPTVTNHLQHQQQYHRQVHHPRVGAVGTWVIVERVTDAWGENDGHNHPMRTALGITDDEKRRNLEADACPGFVSDAWNRVWWTNKAFGDMVAADGEGSLSSSVVRVVAREEVPLTCWGFTCRVRVQQQPQPRKSVVDYCSSGSYTAANSSNCPIMPCDVWRMDHGGFAWRLDVRAALGLSLKPTLIN